jgi:hypothetical protein
MPAWWFSFVADSVVAVYLYRISLFSGILNLTGGLRE